MKTRFAAIALLAGTAAIAGCSKKAPEQLPPAPEQDGTVTQLPDRIPAGAVEGSHEHFVQQVNGQNVIYFETDRYNIDSADAAALQTQAQYLMQYPDVRVTVEGHADERGTREYNLALGERRANAAKNDLVGIGIGANRISTVSYGKERPVALGSTEAAWAQNRRAVTVIIN